MPVKTKLGDFIRERRESLKMSQRSLAKLSGVSHTVINRIESGEVEPTTSSLEAIARGLNVSVQSLLMIAVDSDYSPTAADPIEACLETLNAVLILSLSGDILHANKRFYQTLGYDDSSLIGQPFSSLLQASQADNIAQLLLECQERSVEAEVLLIDSEGQERWMLANVSRVPAQQAVLLVLTDISPFKSTEMTLQSQLSMTNYRLELVLNAIGEGVFGLDTQGRTTFINQAGAEMIGWPVAEIIGKKQHFILHHTKADGSPYPQEECPIYNAFRHGQAYTVMDEVFWRRDGSSFPVAYTSTPLRDQQDNIIGAIVVFRDLTLKHLAEHQAKHPITLVAQVLDALPGPAFVADRHGDILCFNRHMPRSIVSSETSMPMWRWLQQVHPEDLPTAISFCEKLKSADHAMHSVSYRLKLGEALYQGFNITMAPWDEGRYWLFTMQVEGEPKSV